MPGLTKLCCASKDYPYFYIDPLKQNRKDSFWRISWNKFFFYYIKLTHAFNTTKFKAKVILGNFLGQTSYEDKAIEQ